MKKEAIAANKLYMKKVILIILFLPFAGELFSQQEAQFTHYMFNQVFYNPAAAGFNDAFSFTGIYRQQWIGFKDSKGNAVNPRTFLINADGPVNLLHGAVGLSVMQDQLGFDSRTRVNFDYCYRFYIGKGILSAGLQLMFLNLRRDFTKFEVLEQGDPLFANKGVESAMLTDFTGGLMYNIPSKFYVSLASTQLSEASAVLEGSSTVKLKRHYFLSSAYRYGIPGDDRWELEPSVYLESDVATFQYDLSCLVYNKNNYWGGLGYRGQDAVLFMLGVYYQGFRIGYSYDWTTSKLKQGGSMGSHEVMLNYLLKIEAKTPKTRYKNARYM